MPKSKKIAFLQRWMYLIDKINSHPYISKEELIAGIKEELRIYDGVEDIGTQSRTIERDLAEIRTSPFMDISIEYDRQKKGYYIPQDEKSLSKLDRLFEASSLLSFSSLKDIVFPENRPSRGLEYRFSIIEAIRKSVEITVEYCRYAPAAINDTKRLQPYALKEFKNRWYLLAVNAKRLHEKSLTVKTYGLDRIKKLEITNRTFQKDPGFDMKEKFKNCFGIFSNPELEPVRVVLSFSPLSGRYADSCPLHETQKTLFHNEKEFRVELTVKLTPDFMNELLMLSQGMRVIEPVELREKLIEIHKKAIGSLEREATSRRHSP